MRTHTWSLMLISLAAAIAEPRARHAIISYLGSPFVLLDGCPLTPCTGWPSYSDCERHNRLLLALFEQCQVHSERGRFLGCFSDKIGNNKVLTLPKYTSLCAAMCYEKDPRRLRSVHACPHKGRRIRVRGQHRVLASASANLIGKV